MKRLLVERMRLLVFVTGMFALTSVDAQKVTVDGLNYYLYPDTHEAAVDNGNTWSGVLVLPSTISYDGENYTVNGMGHRAFYGCKELTKVRIPKTIDHVVHHTMSGGNGAVSPDYMNPFVGCTTLESIEVDEGNPSMKSVGGVLFSKDGTGLYSYPAGIKSESYRIPHGVTWVGEDAFAYNEHIVSIELPESVGKLCGGVFQNCIRLEKVNLPENLKYLEAYMFRGCSCLKSVTIPLSVSHLGEQAFADCSSLKTIDLPERVSTIGSLAFQKCMLDTLIVRGQLDAQSVNHFLFTGLNESAKVYTLASQIDSFKKLFAGTVLPLEDYKGTQNTVNIGTIIRNDVEAVLHNLQGHRLTTPPRRGVYIRDGRKVVMK